MAFLDRKFYHPSDTIYESPEEHGLAYESVEFTTADDLRLHAWWFPAAGSARATIVHCHGNGGNITGQFVQVSWIPREGFNVLCFDYRGFGRSQGQPTRQGTILDAHAAVDYVRGRADVDERSVLLFGQSLGGAVAIVVAAQREDLAGVAVDGALSNYRDEARWVLQQSWLTRGLAGWLPRWGVAKGCEPIDHVDRVAPTPLYLFHGKEDRVCPWEMSQDLYDKAAEPKGLWLIPDIGHYEALDVLAETARPKLIQFFDACIAAESVKNPDPAAFNS